MTIDQQIIFKLKLNNDKNNCFSNSHVLNFSEYNKNVYSVTA